MKLFFALVIAVTLLSACTSTPETQIDYSPGSAGKPPRISIKAPKDVDIQGFELVRDGTGQATLKIKSYRARMNPDVISAQGAREVDLVNAVGENVRAGMSDGMKLFATGGASSLVGASRPIGASRPVGTPRPAGSVTNTPPINE